MFALSVMPAALGGAVTEPELTVKGIVQVFAFFGFKSCGYAATAGITKCNRGNECAIRSTMLTVALFVL